MQSTSWGHTIDTSTWNLEMLVYEARGNQRTWRKTSLSKDENQQQTQPQYKIMPDPGTEQAALVGSEGSHHCVIPAPCITSLSQNNSPPLWMRF